MFENLAQIVLLLALSVLGPSDLEPLPPEQALMGMSDDCELMAYADMRGGAVGLTAMIDDLAARPFISGSPEAVRALEQLRSRITGLTSDAIGWAGFDPLTELSSISVCARLVPSQFADLPIPDFVVVAQGEFTAESAEQLADSLELGEITLPGGEVVRGSGFLGLLSPADGIIVLGTHSFLADRTRAPLPSTFDEAGPDALVTRLNELLVDGARGYLALEPSPELVALFGAGASWSVGERLAGLERAVLLWDATSSHLELRAASEEAFRDYEYMVTGLRDLVEAAPHLVRGYASLILGALSPDDPELGEFVGLLVRHRDDVMAYLETHGLVTDAEVIYAANPTERQITLTARAARPVALIAAVGVGLALALNTPGGEPQVEHAVTQADPEMPEAVTEAEAETSETEAETSEAEGTGASAGGQEPSAPEEAETQPSEQEEESEAEDDRDSSRQRSQRRSREADPVPETGFVPAPGGF